jgi:octaprenyl-diphosphate synthase
VLLSAACFSGIPAVARELATVVELIHSATLLHDDVADEGTERRGAPASRLLYGNAVSVLAGDMLLVTALERTQTHAPSELGSLIGTIRQLVDGEIIQLRGRTELDVSEATYERVLRGKTGSLFAWAAAVGARSGGAGVAEQNALARFGERVGIAFQLVDDLLDYSGERTGKTLLADLCEGKLTLPLVLAAAKEPSLLELLRKIHAGDQEPVARVSQVVIASGACEEVRRRAKDCTEKAVAELRTLPPTPARRLLEASAFQLAERVN